MAWTRLARSSGGAALVAVEFGGTARAVHPITRLLLIARNALPFGRRQPPPVQEALARAVAVVVLPHPKRSHRVLVQRAPGVHFLIHEKDVGRALHF